ncbi:MAG: hypothetical protein M1837_005539 [Sclerophora amabilis]|nr:MAG: hypothetical protein M1837_005539 [Sclerophora amabilis]
MARVHDDDDDDEYDEYDEDDEYELPELSALIFNSNTTTTATTTNKNKNEKKKKGAKKSLDAEEGKGEEEEEEEEEDKNVRGDDDDDDDNDAGVRRENEDIVGERSRTGQGPLRSCRRKEELRDQGDAAAAAVAAASGREEGRGGGRGGRGGDRDGPQQKRRRRPLRAVQDNSLRFPIPRGLVTGFRAECSDEMGRGKERREEEQQAGRRRSPTRGNTKSVNYREPRYSASDMESRSSVSRNSSFGSLADFVVDDDDEDVEEGAMDSGTGKRRGLTTSKSRRKEKSEKRNVTTADVLGVKVPGVLRLGFPDSATAEEKGVDEISKMLKTTLDLESDGSRPSSFVEEPLATLRFSPPRSPSRKSKQPSYVTPPGSPMKNKAILESPSKQSRIPPSPHRPSMDTFWSQALVNDWNDQYSPKKTPRTRRLRIADSDDDEVSPSSSPRKSPVKKKDRMAQEMKKAFNQTKHQVAESFLKELDEKVTGSQVTALAASAGGIQLVWSKKLNTTAGRANWRREAIRQHSGVENIAPTTIYRHRATIELAEKVIDNEDRLINVIAHEYCHLATFMISGVKDNPHGKQFKEWARKCSLAFHHRNIHVTTKHSYTISYKYIWACTACGIEYKRHSRSINPARHTCGACKATLIQTQPTPRNTNTHTCGDGDGGGRGRAPSDYQRFVKDHFHTVRRDHPESPQKEIMGLLGKRYREWKSAAAAGGRKTDEDGGRPNLNLKLQDTAKLKLLGEGEGEGRHDGGGGSHGEHDTDTDTNTNTVNPVSMNEEQEDGARHRRPSDRDVLDVVVDSVTRKLDILEID